MFAVQRAKYFFIKLPQYRNRTIPSQTVSSVETVINKLHFIGVQWSGGADCFHPPLITDSIHDSCLGGC